MQLAGQGIGRSVADRSGLDERGYIMVVLLVAMGVTAVWMAAALPSWRQQAQREKEAELVYRGEQYARAIALYMRKNNGSLPPNVDLLISQRYLRKKYKDPITDDDFQFIGGLMPGQSGAAPPQSVPGAPQNPGQSGISGVRSKSQATSIRTYYNQTTYAQWAFDGLAMMARMGMSPQQGRPGGPGGPGVGGAPPGGRPGGAPPGGRPGGPGGAPAGGRPGGPGAPASGGARPGGGGPPASGSGS